MLYTLSDNKVVVLDIKRDFELDADVCVIGLGTAGALAAISAAESGVSVIGIERTSHLGGAGTAGAVYDYYYGTPGGRAMPINEECYRRIDAGQYVSSGGRAIREESLPGVVKDMVLLERAASAGCRMLLECSLTGVFMEGQKAVGVQVFDGERLVNISCRVIVDSADGIVCRMAGCEFEHGRPSDGHTMKLSHTYAGWDGRWLRFGISQFDFPEVDSAAEWSELIMRSVVYGGLLRDDYGWRLIYFSAMLSVREVYTVRADESYTMSDVFAGVKADRPLMYGFAPVDNANSDDENETELVQDWKVLAEMRRFGMSAAIPMGAMLPAGKDGIIVACKAIGVGHDMIGCLRMKLDMEKCGEAAGVWAALACSRGQGVREVDYGELTSLLSANHCFDPTHDYGLCDLNQPLERHWQPYIFPKTVDEFRQRLSSREPGPAIWAVRTHCTDELREALLSWLDSDDRLLAESSAVALGVTGDRRCMPALRGILGRAPECYCYHVEKSYSFYDINKTTFCNYVKAICLLGRFRDAESVPALRAIVSDGGRAAGSALRSDEGCPPAETMAKKFADFAASALKNIENPL